ncbi:MAG: MarR family transcriptional regulator [Caldilineae bacterium]|nr:MAG: MarR family transcriptional regulator [Caldilineae bacterium]
MTSSESQAAHADVESKIIASLERLSQVLRQLLRAETQAHRLSPIQMQFLIHLASHPPELCRVTHLAREFHITQPTVSDAVNTLINKGLVEKEPWPHDRRVSILRLTPAGRAVAEELADWADSLKPFLAEALSAEERVSLMVGLMKWIAALERGGIISSVRMCLTCRFFAVQPEPANRTPYYCHLLEQPLSADVLRLDCPEHERTPRKRKA